MQIINAVLIDDVLAPKSVIPADAVKVVCNGTTYTVYEAGDELPPEPIK